MADHPRTYIYPAELILCYCISLSRGAGRGFVRMSARICTDSHLVVNLEH
ncbi:hypothetical protein F442_19476 [Phytophthora nicotianae P10297]|uniref:Uncharacterized protein n=1 Tax=Phytophthora nicotianae P10297 TaxID=1317064 RepID=W2Y9H5_PHYNI|nr:hypothetical protein F442_19476 [Phytophthora nicotianae P10297]